MNTNLFAEEIAFLQKELDFPLKGAYLAGGAITSVFTNRKIKDFDLYFKTKETFLDALSEAYDSNFWCVALTDRAATFIRNNDKIYQFMCFDWFPTAQAIFDKFDFTTCMAALDLDGGGLAYDPRFLSDTSRRVLRFNHQTQFPLGSAMRVKKYQSRGYTIEDSEFLKVMIACAFKSPKTWDELRSQIGGQYGEAVTLDTSQEFNVENAVKALGDAIAKPRVTGETVAGTYEEALVKIFGNAVKDEI